MLNTNYLNNSYDSFKSGRCTDVDFLYHQFIGENNPGHVTKHRVTKTYSVYVIRRDNLHDYDGYAFTEFKIIDLYDNASCIYKIKKYGKRIKTTNKQFWDDSQTVPAVANKLHFIRDTKY